MQELQQINRLIDAARSRCGTGNDNTVAAKLGVGPKVLSNWRTGHKKPSIEALCDIAAIAGVSVPKTALIRLVETTEGPRQRRFAEALETQLDLEGDTNPVLRARLEELKTMSKLASATAERLERIDETRATAEQRSRAKLVALISQLDTSDEIQAGAAKMMQAMLDAFPNESISSDMKSCA